jgi:amidophosphoribosyltransferase
MAIDQDARDYEARGKHDIYRAGIEGNHLVVVDDSGFRGTQSKALTTHLINAGAKSVHWRFAFPMAVDTCDLGVALSQKEELIAYRHNRNIAAMTAEIGATSIGFISVEGFTSVLSKHVGNLCLKCVGGEPITPQIPAGRRQLPIATVR